MYMKIEPYSTLFSWLLSVSITIWRFTYSLFQDISEQCSVQASVWLSWS